MICVYLRSNKYKDILPYSFIRINILALSLSLIPCMLENATFMTRMLHTLMLYYIALRYDMIMLSHAPHIHVHSCTFMHIHAHECA